MNRTVPMLRLVHRDGQEALIRWRLRELKEMQIRWRLRSRDTGPTVLCPINAAGNAKDAGHSDELPVLDP